MRILILQFKKLGADIFGTVTSVRRMMALWSHPLYSNALYIMLAKAADAIVGFAFWILAARFYTTEEVGQASALLSATTLLATLSGLGLGYGLIRFLGVSRNPVTLINSSFAVVAAASLAAVGIFIVGPGLWSPAVTSTRHDIAYLAIFVLAVPATAVTDLADYVFIARRAARFMWARNLVFNTLRLVLPVVLAAYLHSFGIYASWGGGIFVSLLFSVFLFLPRAQPGYRVSLNLDRHAVVDMSRFSLANYLSNLFFTAPILVLQSILVVRLLGTESNAYLAIAWAMGSALIALPTAVSMSLFAEGSHDESRLGQSVSQSLKMTFVILTPAVLLLAVFADKLLLMFRAEYSQNATTLLRLLAVSAFPVAVNSLYFGVKRVEKKMKVVILLIVLGGTMTLGLSCALMPRMGVDAVGVAWLVSQSCVSLIVIANWLGRKLKG